MKRRQKGRRADHAEKMVVAQQGGSGLDGVAYYSTCSVSVTVGTIHPQRFWEGSFEGQDESDTDSQKEDREKVKEEKNPKNKQTVKAHGHVRGSLKTKVTFQSAKGGQGEWAHVQA